MHHAKNHGLATACLAGIGRLIAFAMMIALAAAGLAAILFASETLFNAIKIIGAAYLFWLAFKLWRADVAVSDELGANREGIFQLGCREFLLAAGNPKAILIFTAFLPQFVDPAKAAGEQFLQLGALFLMLEWIAILSYGCLGTCLRGWFNRPHMRRLFNRGCAGLLFGAGSGLLLSGRD